MDLSKANAVIFVFVQPGCPACTDFAPKFKKAAEGHPCPVIELDLTKDSAIIADMAKRFRIKSTPTVIVAPRGAKGYAAWEGEQDAAGIQHSLETARRVA